MAKVSVKLSVKLACPKFDYNKLHKHEQAMLVREMTELIWKHPAYQQLKGRPFTVNDLIEFIKLYF